MKNGSFSLDSIARYAMRTYKVSTDETDLLLTKQTSIF